MSWPLVVLLISLGALFSPAIWFLVRVVFMLVTFPFLLVLSHLPSRGFFGTIKRTFLMSLPEPFTFEDCTAALKFWAESDASSFGDRVGIRAIQLFLNTEVKRLGLEAFAREDLMLLCGDFLGCITAAREVEGPEFAPIPMFHDRRPDALAKMISFLQDSASTHAAEGGIFRPQFAA